MFIVTITYKKPLEMIDQYLAAHRAYLDKGYQENWLLASGPKVPRVGGIIISQLKDREKLQDFINHDPFKLNDIADYDIIEFIPVKYHEQLTALIE